MNQDAMGAFEAQVVGTTLKVMIRREFDSGQMTHDWAIRLLTAHPGPFHEVRIDLSRCVRVSQKPIIFSKLNLIVLLNSLLSRKKGAAKQLQLKNLASILTQVKKFRFLVVNMVPILNRVSLMFQCLKTLNPKM